MILLVISVISEPKSTYSLSLRKQGQTIRQARCQSYKQLNSHLDALTEK